jgi:hypothetical protein
MELFQTIYISIKVVKRNLLDNLVAKSKKRSQN